MGMRDQAEDKPLVEGLSRRNWLGVGSASVATAVFRPDWRHRRRRRSLRIFEKRKAIVRQTIRGRKTKCFWMVKSGIDQYAAADRSRRYRPHLVLPPSTWHPQSAWKKAAGHIR